ECIVNVSDANRQLALQNGIAPERRMVVIHNGVSDTPHRAHAAAAGIPKIVMVARFSEQKDQLGLLEALAQIDSPFRVVLVGNGVEFLGIRTDIPEILSQCQIFALCTRWEGFPLSTIEAMRAGLPVVASDVGGVREAVQDGVTGLLTPPCDVPAFRNALQRM